MIEFAGINFENGFDGNGGYTFLTNIFVKLCNIVEITAAVDLDFGMKAMETSKKVNDRCIVGVPFGGIDQKNIARRGLIRRDLRKQPFLSIWEPRDKSIADILLRDLRKKRHKGVEIYFLG